MAITAALVKQLRDSTGAGMMDAKKALTEDAKPEHNAGDDNVVRLQKLAGIK